MCLSLCVSLPSPPLSLISLYFTFPQLLDTVADVSTLVSDMPGNYSNHSCSMTDLSFFHSTESASPALSFFSARIFLFPIISPSCLQYFSLFLFFSLSCYTVIISHYWYPYSPQPPHFYSIFPNLRWYEASVWLVSSSGFSRSSGAKRTTGRVRTCSTAAVRRVVRTG